MRLRLVAAFVGASAALLSVASMLRAGAGDVDPGYYSLSAEVARFGNMADMLTVMNTPVHTANSLMSNNGSFSQTSD